MYTGIFVHSNGPGGVVHGGGEDLKKRLDPGAGEGRRRGRECPVMYTRILFTRTALEEPFTTAERFDLGDGVGDQGGPPRWERSRNYGHQNFCPPATVLEELSWKSEGRVRV
jgi:hypothetical protein